MRKAIMIALAALMLGGCDGELELSSEPFSDVDPAIYDKYTEEDWPGLHAEIGKQQIQRMMTLQRKAVYQATRMASCKEVIYIGPRRSAASWPHDLPIFVDCVTGKRLYFSVINFK